MSPKLRLFIRNNINNKTRMSRKTPQDYTRTTQDFYLTKTHRHGDFIFIYLTKWCGEDDFTI
jgi:hypothetical protein